jgi:hypothetical protein
MAPPHVISFRKFETKIPNRLEASIAFGLLMESERQWATREENPSDAKYRNYQEALLNDHEIERYAKQAREFLGNFGSSAVASKQAEFLEESLEQYKSLASQGHGRFRAWGIVEAVTGAFVWTLALIAISFLLKYAGIDLVEVYHKVVGR